MKIRIGLALAIGSMAMTGISAQAAAPEGAQRAAASRPTATIPMHTARTIARRLISRVVRFHDNLQGSELRRCQRSTDSIYCRLLAHGTSTKRRTTCKYEVAVTRVSRHPRGEVVDHECESVKTPHLGRKAAARAMWRTLEQTAIPGSEFARLVLGRVGRFEFRGVNSWIRQINPRTAELCDMNMDATLAPGESEVLIKVTNFKCIIAT